ncbi:MAG: ATP-binding protein, partial [Nanoarchaeota archaeon]|nr:ATP-binding protein [Nanoarchaeota archaeon]
MLVYEGTKSQFCTSVLNDTISDEIYEAYQKKIGKTAKKEITSWSDSMQYMYKVVQSEEIPNNCGIAIEFRIPATSKRVDFIISGKDENKTSSVIIIELKRWDEAHKVEGKDAIVLTPLGRGLHETTHPSYQAWSYYNLIKDFNENVQKENIEIYPCAYLHNLDRDKNLEIEDSVYAYYIEQAPLYTKGEALKLRRFITKFIKYGDNREALYKIDSGRLKPSKSLQDSL